MKTILIDLFVAALQRVISTRSLHPLYGYEMRQINRIGKNICRRVAGKNVRAQKSFMHAVIYNTLDSLTDGLDHLRFVETYPQYIDALAGDDSERACGILLDMMRLYRCTGEESTHLGELMAGSKHWQHYYREYC
jgi:hypothetical protein